MDFKAYQEQLAQDIASARINYSALVPQDRQALAVRAEVVRLWQSLTALKAANSNATTLADLLASAEAQWFKTLLNGEAQL